LNDDAHDDGSRQRRMFVKPQERIMSLVEFRDQLRSSRRMRLQQPAGKRDADNRWIVPLLASSEDNTEKDDLASALSCSASAAHHDESPSVFYYSRQNDCLRTELQPLFESTNLLPRTIDFAEAAFGTGPPDAINLWIGDERAVSSMHKDHYENLFYVLCGEKVFTLLPPSSAPFLYARDFPSGCFAQKATDGEWGVIPDETDDHDKGPQSVVKWIEPDVEILLSDDTKAKERLFQRFPLLKHVQLLQVHVQAGDMLYLPALWFHCVTQTCETVGCNYWYDMHFDSPQWCYFNFLQQLQPPTKSHENSNV
jgi:jumonji domain-containing protein 7